MINFSFLSFFPNFKSTVLSVLLFNGYLLLLISCIATSNVYAGYSKEYKVHKNPNEREYIRDQDDEKYKYKDPTVKTQINEKTDLFDKSIDNWSGFQNELESGKFVPTKGSELRLDFMDKGGMDAARSEKDSLSSIKASELDDKGRRELAEFRSSFGDGGDIYVDHEKPLHKQNWLDAEAIAEGQDELLGKLIGGLKKVGVDCKTVLGPKVVEPEYYLQIKKEQHKDVIYNQTMCEELRGNYNCTDSMSITCEKRGMKWYEWESKTIKVPGRELVGSGYNVLRNAHVAASVYELKLFAPNSSDHSDKWGRINFDSVPEMRRYLSDKNQVTREHISDDMSFGWEGGVYGLGGKEHAWNTYIINYKIRDGEEICEKWSNERWDESCNQIR